MLSGCAGNGSVKRLSTAASVRKAYAPRCLSQRALTLQGVCFARPLRGRRIALTHARTVLTPRRQSRDHRVAPGQHARSARLRAHGRLRVHAAHEALVVERALQPAAWRREQRQGLLREAVLLPRCAAQVAGSLSLRRAP